MTATVKISGMSCGHCVMHVKKALASIPGVQAEVEIGKAVVTGENVNMDAVKAAIEDAGYDVVAVQ